MTKRCKFGALALITGLSISASAVADEAVLTCTGQQRTLVNPADGSPRPPPRDVSFEVLIDLEAKTVTEGGKERFVREFSDDTIVYSAMRPGMMSSLINADVTTISRRTGVWRNQYGSGTCQRGAAQRLF